MKKVFPKPMTNKEIDQFMSSRKRVIAKRTRGRLIWLKRYKRNKPK